MKTTLIVSWIILMSFTTTITYQSVEKKCFFIGKNQRTKESSSCIQESFKQTERRQAENKASQNLLQDIIENKNRKNPNKSIELNEKVSNDDEMTKQISGKLASFSKENVIKEGNPKSKKMLQKTITQSKTSSASANVLSDSQSTPKLTKSVSSKSIYKKNDSNTTETSDSEIELVKDTSYNTDSSLDNVKDKESDKSEDEQEEDEKDLEKMRLIIEM